MITNKKLANLLPGSLSVNIFLVIFSLIFIGLAFYFNINNVGVSILIGLGSAMFLAGFLGIVNLKILANEIAKVTSQPILDTILYNKLINFGIRDIFRDRASSLENITSEIDIEGKELIISGSSLKGLIGVGLITSGRALSIREAILHALMRNVKVNILMTNPEVAHHRSTQEGRRDGDIEAEILENILYFVKLRKDDIYAKNNLTVKLYNGTPTIFMLSTSNLMLLNPYPYYSTAYSSFSFHIKGNSLIYNTYYYAHYSSAWEDDRLSTTISNEHEIAKKYLESLIRKKNPHGRFIIPDTQKQDELIDKLSRL